MKIVTQESTGRQFKMGRVRPITPHCKVSLNELVREKVLPAVVVPANTHFSGKAATSLHSIYGNDVLGDCVVAGAFHVRGVTSANANGNPTLFNHAQIVHDYSAIGGYDPSQTQPNGTNPTDNGCDENTALNYWQNTGFPDGIKLMNSIAIDATNIHEVRLAMYLFENVFFGVELPDGWINPFPSGPGFRWDVAGVPDPNNGHCFIGCDLVPNGLKICTWGMCGYLTNAAISYYASTKQGGQLFTMLTPDIINRVTQKSPVGYDINTLTEYLAQL